MDLSGGARLRPIAGPTPGPTAVPLPALLPHWIATSAAVGPAKGVSLGRIQVPRVCGLRLRVVAHAGPQPSRDSNVRQFRNASELRKWQSDTRNAEISVQWPTIFANRALLAGAPLFLPAALHGLLISAQRSKSFLTGSRVDDFLELAKSGIAECVTIAAGLGPEEVLQILQVAATLQDLSGYNTRRTSKQRKKSDIAQKCEDFINKACPGAVTGASVQQMLDCITCLRSLGLDPHPALFTQLRSSLAAPQDKFLETCELPALVSVAQQLLNSNQVQHLSAPAVTRLRAAVERLEATIAVPQPGQKQALKISVQGAAPRRGGSGSGRGSGDGPGTVELRQTALPVDAALTLARQFMRLPASAQTDGAWAVQLAMSTLAGVTSRDVQHASTVVALCADVLRSPAYQSRPVSTQQVLLRQVCITVTTFAQAPRNGKAREFMPTYNYAMSCTAFPALLSAMADVVTTPDSTLVLPASFVGAVAEHQQAQKQPWDAALAEQVSSALRKLGRAQLGPDTQAAQERNVMRAVAQAAAVGLMSEEKAGRVEVRVADSQQATRLLRSAAALDTRNTDFQLQAEQQLERFHSDLDQHTSTPKVLLYLAQQGVAPCRAQTLDICLLPLDELVTRLSPTDLASIVTVVATAPWVGQSRMRARLLAACHGMLQRCSTAGELCAVVQAAGRLAAVPVADKLTIRLTYVNCDVGNMVVAPAPEVWSGAVQRLLLGPRPALRGFSTLTPTQRAHLLYSLCIHLAAAPSPALVTALLQPLTLDGSAGFKACSPHDVVCLLELARHWRAAPVSHEWLLQLLTTAQTTLTGPGSQGVLLTRALDCLPVLARNLPVLSYGKEAPVHDSSNPPAPEPAASAVPADAEPAPSPVVELDGLTSPADTPHEDVPVLEADRSSSPEPMEVQSPAEAGTAQALNTRDQTEEADTSRLVTGTVVLLVGDSYAILQLDGYPNLAGRLDAKDVSSEELAEGDLSAVLQKGQRITALRLRVVERESMMYLSTRDLEPWPGAMLEASEVVMEHAEDTWARKLAERRMYKRTGSPRPARTTSPPAPAAASLPSTPTASPAVTAEGGIQKAQSASTKAQRAPAPQPSRAPGPSAVPTAPPPPPPPQQQHTAASTTSTDSGSGSTQPGGEAVREAVRSLAAALHVVLLSDAHRDSVVTQPVLLARVPDHLLQLGVEPDMAWLQAFEKDTRSLLRDIGAESPAALIRMLWAVQQLGATPAWTWVADVATKAEPYLQHLASTDPAQLGTLTAGLHCSLSDPARSSYVREQPGTGFELSKRPVVGGEALAGTRYADANVRYLEAHAQEVAWVELQAVKEWLRACNTQPGLYAAAGPDMLAVLVQALGSMQLQAADPLSALLVLQPPVDPGYLQLQQQRAARPAPTPVPTSKRQAKQRAGGKAGRAASPQPNRSPPVAAKLYTPTAEWVERVCAALQRLDAAAQRARADTKPAQQVSMAAALLSLMRASAGTASSARVKQYVSQRLGQLPSAWRALRDQDRAGQAEELLGAAACRVFVDTCAACGLTVPPVLAKHYFKLCVDQGFLSGAEALDRLQAAGHSLQLWEVQQVVQALGAPDKITGKHTALDSQGLRTLCELLLRLLRLETRPDQLATRREAGSSQGASKAAQLTSLRTFLSSSVPQQLLASDAGAAGAYLSCCVTYLQLRALLAPGGAGQSDAQLSQVLAWECLESAADILPARLLATAFTTAAAEPTAQAAGGQAAAQALRVALMSEVIHFAWDELVDVEDASILSEVGLYWPYELDGSVFAPSWSAAQAAGAAAYALANEQLQQALADEKLQQAPPGRLTTDANSLGTQGGPGAAISAVQASREEPPRLVLGSPELPWDVVQPAVLAKNVYGTSPFWAGLLCRQLLEVLLDASVPRTPPNPAWVATLLQLQQQSEGAVPLDNRVLDVILAAEFMEPGRLEALCEEARRPVLRSIPNLLGLLEDLCKSVWVSADSSQEDMLPRLRLAYALAIARRAKPDANLGAAALTQPLDMPKFGEESVVTDLTFAALQASKFTLPKTASVQGASAKEVRALYEAVLGFMILWLRLHASALRDTPLLNTSLHTMVVMGKCAPLLPGLLSHPSITLQQLSDFMNVAEAANYIVPTETAQALLRKVVQTPRLIWQALGPGVLSRAVGLTLGKERTLEEYAAIEQSLTDQEVAQLIADVAAVRGTDGQAARAAVAQAALALALRTHPEQVRTRRPGYLDWEPGYSVCMTLKQAQELVSRCMDGRDVSRIRTIPLAVRCVTSLQVVREQAEPDAVDLDFLLITGKWLDFHSAFDKGRLSVPHASESKGLMLRYLVVALRGWGDSIDLSDSILAVAQQALRVHRKTNMFTPSEMILLAGIQYGVGCRAGVDRVSNAALGRAHAYMPCELHEFLNLPNPETVKGYAAASGAQLKVLESSRCNPYAGDLQRAPDDAASPYMEKVHGGLLSLLVRPPAGQSLQPARLQPSDFAPDGTGQQVLVLPRHMVNRSVSTAYIGGGPFIAGQHDEVWRCALAYGLAVHGSRSAPDDVINRACERYVEAGNKALKARPPPRVEAVLTWIGPAITTYYTRPAHTPVDVPVRAWLQGASWDMLGDPDGVHPNMTGQLLSMLIGSTYFRDAFLTAYREQVNARLQGGQKATGGWLSQLLSPAERAPASPPSAVDSASLDRVAEAVGARTEEFSGVTNGAAVDAIARHPFTAVVVLCLRVSEVAGGDMDVVLDVGPDGIFKFLAAAVACQVVSLARYGKLVQALTTEEWRAARAADMSKAGDIARKSERAKSADMDLTGSREASTGQGAKSGGRGRSGSLGEGPSTGFGVGGSRRAKGKRVGKV